MDNNERIWKVYKHTSPSGKCYIGITHYNDPNTRWQNGLGYKRNPFFIKAILKYGWDNIYHEILNENLTYSEACLIERQLIAHYKQLGISYNSADGGSGKTGRLTEETKAKISESLKKNPRIPWNKGKTGIYSDETIAAISNGVRNYMEEHPEVRKKISETQKGRIAHNKGKKMGPMTQEHKKKISEANKGKNTWSKGVKRGRYSEEHCKHISEGLKGKRKGISNGPRPDDVKNKISETRKGVKWICKPWLPPKQIQESQLQEYLEDGWILGKTLTDELSNKYTWSKLNQEWILK